MKKDYGFDVKKSGQFIKKIAKQKGFSNQQMCDLLHYSRIGQISDMYSGKRPLSDWHYEKLSKIWNISVAELKCISEFENNKNYVVGYSMEYLKEMFGLYFKQITDLNFEIIYHGQSYGCIDADDLETFIFRLSKISKATIETLLIDDRY